METLNERRPDLQLVEIMVRPLDRDTSEALIHNMLQIKGLRHGIQGQIIDRTGGNPFFIEEVVPSLIDEGAIVRKNGAFEVTEKIDRAVIPATINDVLIARIDRLEGQTRELVKTATVIGRSFFDRIIRDVAAAIDGLDHRLTYLGARPDLARTYFEVGKSLMEPQSKYKELSGLSSQEYLAKAEKLFREMDLEWDLEQLERVRARG